MPAGQVLILRTIVLWNATGGVMTFSQVRDAAGPLLHREDSTANGEAWEWATWLVFDPGDVLEVYGSAQPYTVVAAGQLLSQV